jgi:putative MATE family efflux protein
VTRGGAEPSVNRQIVALAVPALGALLAEPLFLLADSAIVGHLGTVPLAGLALAGTVLTTVVGLAVFLAYGTTASVARLLGAGQPGEALRRGIDGLWLAVVIGGVVAVGVWALADPLIRLLGGDGDVRTQAVIYLRWSAPGLPGMLVVLAATGVLRGLHRTSATLWVAAAGAVVNAAANVVLVYGADLGIAGSAIGTAAVQTAMGITLAALVLGPARRAGAGLAPRWSDIGRAGLLGFPVFLRTVTLRAAVVLTVVVGATKGNVALAALQVTMNVWNLLAMGLDALAIAAQTLTAHALGRGDAAAARRLTDRLLRLGLYSGFGCAVVLIATSPVLGPLFTDDAAVIAAVAGSLWVLAVGQLPAGPVFVLDGILLGAGDGRYLAVASTINLVVYAPVLWAVAAFAPDGTVGLRWVWAGFILALMGSRVLTLGIRYRSDQWIRTGI